MKSFNQMKISAAIIMAALLSCFLGGQTLVAGVTVSVTYPPHATPCDTLSVTTKVVNTGATLSQLSVSQILPGGTSYQYVSNSLQVTVSGGVTITNEAGVLTLNGGTNLVFDFSHLQSTNGPTNLLISEVFPGGSSLGQQWLELYNPTANPISLAGWSIRDARPGVSESLPTVTIQPGQFLVVAASTNSFLSAYPSFTNALVEISGNLIGNGLNRYADGLFLVNSNSVTVDKISWGFDTSGLNPAVPYTTTTTASLARNPANVNSGTAHDWVQQNTPDPGSGVVQSGVASGTTISIVYQLTAKCGGVGGYFNTAASYQQPPGSSNQISSSVNFIAFETPVLLVSKTPQVQQAALNDLVTWQLQVHNSGFGVARNTVLYDSIDSGLVFVGFSVNPVTPNPTATNAVYWDASVIPALAGLTNGDAPISVTVTARVTSCTGHLNNRGDASFGCDISAPCQDTHNDSSGALAAIEYSINRPYLDFSITPTNPIQVAYCGGVDITIAVTNDNYSNGGDAYAVGVIPNLVPGYSLVPYGPYTTNSAGALILSSFLAKGASTNIVVHLQPGGVCPVDTNLVAQLITPVYSDNCNSSYENPVLPLLSYITGQSAAAVYETISPSWLEAGATTNVSVAANLVYANMGAGSIPQNLVQKYPVGAGWGLPYNISGGGVLDTNANTITWTTNVSGTGEADFTFQIHVTKSIYCSTNDTDYFPLQPAVYLDCLGCPQNVDTNSLSSDISTYGCICTNCYGGNGSNCTFAAVINDPKPIVETCEPQSFTLNITNFTGSFPNGWSGVRWSARLSGHTVSFTNNYSVVSVVINGQDVSSYITVSQFGGTLQARFDNLTNHPSFSSVSTVTNLQISWDAAVSQIGAVSQDVQFNLCTVSTLHSSWTVGTSLMSVALTPPFLGFECGIISIPIRLAQVPTPPYNLFQTNNALFPDYDVDVVLNLDPKNDPTGQGTGTPIPTLSYVTNSSSFVNIISNALGSPLILTNEPTLTNNLVIWHLGNLGVFTNGTINSKFQMKCGGAAIQHIQALLRYNNRCAQGSVPQLYTNQSTVGLVSDQASSLQANVSPALVSLITTNFNFLVQVMNTLAAPAHNFFIELQVPTNIVLTGAAVPWNYEYSLNSGTNAYRWTFTNNTAPLQGLIDDLGDGSYNDLAYKGSFSLSVTGAVVTCGNQQINTIAGAGCQGSVCQTVGPLPVNLQTFEGKAVAMLVFPTTLPICQTNALYYDVRNAGIASIYKINPSFYLPNGLTYVAGSAVATNVLTGQTMGIPDPTGSGTKADPFVWTESQVLYLAELVTANDVIVGFKVRVACDATVNGEGGASATYLDTCGGFKETALELSAANLGLPVLSLTKGFFDLNDQPKAVSMPGETNVFHLTIQHTAQSVADVQRLELTDFFPTNSFAFLGASIPPDAIVGGQLIWSNATLLSAVSNQIGGVYAITSAPISLVITSLTLANCSSPVVNSAVINYGCADSPCQSTSASASVILTADLQYNSPSQNLQLNSCGGTYSVKIQNNGAPANGIVWTNFAPAGYLIAAATVSGDFYNQSGQTAPLTLVNSGQSAILDLTSTNVTNVRGGTNYASGIPGDLYLGPGQSFTVTFTLVSDGSTLDCTVNTYPPSPAPVTITNAVSFDNYCGTPATVRGTYTALPDQPKPTVDLEPKSLIVTNGQVQDFVVTISNLGDHGGANNLQARVLFQTGWINLVILGVTNNTAGGVTNTGSLPITVETNGQNGVLADLGGVVVEPLETVVLGVRATATQGGNPLGVKAEVVGSCGLPSPNACSTFSPTNPLAMTLPPSTNISQLTNNTIYGFYQDNENAVGFNLAKTVRYNTESAGAAGTNRIARIGENLIYRITAQFFDAPFTNIIVNDSLPPNLVFGTPVDAGSSTNVTGWTFNPANGNFTLPAIVTNDATFVVDIPVIVTNGLLNQAGISFTNAASSAFQTVVTNQPPPVNTVVTDIEPTLNVSTLVSTNATSFAGSASGVQAGDTLYYQIVITNGLGANAYDLLLSNSLPAGFTSPTVVSVSSVGNVFTNGVAAVGSLPTDLVGFTGNTLNVAGTNEVDLNTNSALVIVVSAQPGYTVQPSQVFTDDTTIWWASLPGYSAQERTGTGLTPAPGVNASTNDSVLNNYAATSAAAVTTDLGVTFTKTLVGTDHTAPGNGNTNVVIGELVSYTLTLTIPQGTTTNAVITDTLPGGLAFVDVTNVTLSPNVFWTQPVTVATNPANTVIANTGHTATFSLGNVTNLNSNDGAASVAITFRAVVLDVITNQAGTNLINTAQFTSGALTNNATAAAVLVVEPTLQVTEQVSTNPATGYTASLSNIQGGDTVYYKIVVTNSAGVNGTTAYDLWLSNSLPAGLINPVVYSVTNLGVGSLYTNGVLATGSLTTNLFGYNGSVLTLAGTNVINLDTNAAFAIVVSAQLSYSVNPLQNLTNSTLIEWTSLPGTQTNLSIYNTNSNERTGVTSPLPSPGVNNSTNNSLLDNYAAAAQAISTVKAPSLSKALVGTDHTAPGNGNTNVVIGELVTYTLTATVPQGVTTNASIVDTLPGGLAFVDVTNVTLSPNVTWGQAITVGTNPAYTTITTNGHSVTFSFGNVTNLNTDDSAEGFTITFRAVALDVITNHAGTNLVNNAQFKSGSISSNATSAAVLVVEPTLQVTELISSNNVNYAASVGTLDAGDTVYYRIVITNSTVVNGTTAYDLWLSNSLPAGLTNLTVYSLTNLGAGNVYTNGTVGNGGLSTSLFSINNNYLTVAGTNEIDLATNSALVLVVSGQLVGTVSPGQTLSDTNTIEWASLPGTQTNLSIYNTNSNERTGVSTPLPAPGVNNSTNNALLDNYAAATGATITIPAAVLSKGIVAVDEPGVTGNSGVNGTNATIGEVITYRITVGLPEGVTGNLVVTDQLPAGLAFVTNSVSLSLSRPANANANIPGGGTEAFGGTVPTPVTITPSTPTNGAIVFSFGSITVNSDNDPSNNVFSFTYQAVVLNIATNSGLSNAQTKWTNTFTWAAGSSSGSGLSDASGNVVAVVEPKLNFQQSLLVDNNLGQTCAYYGSPVVYTLTVQPATNSLSTAFNVAFSDQLPLPIGATLSSPLTMANITITNNAGVDLSSYFTFSGGLLQTTNGSTLSLAINSGLTIVISGVVNSASLPVGGYTNAATLNYSSRNGDYTTNGGFNPNPLLTTDQERLYSASNSTAITLNLNSISGYVYADANNDGTKQGGETGLSGVTVTLTGTNSVNSQAVSLSTNTASDGSYSFGALLPGNYVLTRTTTPAGYIDGKETAGSSFGGSVRNNTNSVTISGISISGCSSSSGTNYNFGLIQPNSLSGLVFADYNRDGVMDGADYPITNVTITLTGTDDRGNSVSNVFLTLTNGTYDFTGLRPSTNYTITETQPTGYGQGTNALGSTGGTNSAQDVFSHIVLTQNQNGTNYNFGETVASIGNYVWNDANGDGVRQTAEQGMPGVRVYLDLNHDNHYQTNEPSALTDSQGYYLITNLLAGTYTVAVDTNTLPAGASETYDLDGVSTTNKVSSVALAAGTNRLDCNFGYRYISPTLVTGLTFQGFVTNGGVELKWTTKSEYKTLDYIVNRQAADGTWSLVTFVPAANSLAGGSYTTLDASATAQGFYHYQLVEEQTDGVNNILDCIVVVSPLNQIGFDTTGASSVVLEACTNFASPVWLPIQTNSVSSGTSYFDDPDWTNYPVRFYRLRLQP